MGAAKTALSTVLAAESVEGRAALQHRRIVRYHLERLQRAQRCRGYRGVQGVQGVQASAGLCVVPEGSRAAGRGKQAHVGVKFTPTYGRGEMGVSA